jgi:pyruvate/2-oxoglutarate dehydrogenase complex dihydrolipoamide acyltransferase (E2) component
MLTNTPDHALSPTMGEGNLARWLNKVGDPVRAGRGLAWAR